MKNTYDGIIIGINKCCLHLLSRHYILIRSLLSSLATPSTSFLDSYSTTYFYHVLHPSYFSFLKLQTPTSRLSFLHLISTRSLLSSLATPSTSLLDLISTMLFFTMDSASHLFFSQITNSHFFACRSSILYLHVPTFILSLSIRIILFPSILLSSSSRLSSCKCWYSVLFLRRIFPCISAKLMEGGACRRAFYATPKGQALHQLTSSSTCLTH